MATFKVGDIVELYRMGFDKMLQGRNGTLGRVTELRSYPIKSGRPTHYVIKFTSFTIPHIFSIWDIENCCRLYKVKDYERK